MDYILLIFFVICILFAVLGGAVRGAKRTLIRIGLVAGSGLLAVLISKPLVMFAVKKTGYEHVITSNAGDFSDLFSASSTLRQFCDNLPAYILGPLAFAGLFLVLCFVTWILGGIAMRNIPKDHKSKGLLYGLAAGLVSFAIICAPMATLLLSATDIAQSVSSDFVQQLEDELNITGKYDDVEDAVNRTTVCRILNPMGKAMLRELSGKRINGTRIALFDEVYSFRYVIGGAVPILYGSGRKEFDQNSLKALLPELSKSVSESKLLKKVLPELARSAAAKWSSGESFCGILPGSENPAENVLVSFVIDNKDSINEKTLGKLFEMLSKTLDSADNFKEENGAFSFESIISADAVSDIIAAALDDPQLRPLADGIVDAAVESLASQYDSSVFDQASVMLNEINSSDDPDELIRRDAEMLGINANDALVKYIREYIEGHFGGSDWTGDSLKKAIENN